MSHTTTPHYTIAVAGSTARTQQCLAILFGSKHYTIAYVITPEAKIVGRKKELKINPVQEFAQKNNIPVLTIEKKFTPELRAKIHQMPAVDLLLVVDFGYFIPRWLLAVPSIAPLNIHPSKLPRWRGSSPAQYAILFGETHSAVTLMVMNEKLDEGPIITQIPFAVPATYDSPAYYARAFKLMCEALEKQLLAFCATRSATPQPLVSPTPTAALLSTEASYVPWELLKLAERGQNPSEKQLALLTEPLLSAYRQHGSLARTLERASKAFVPWPSLWTTAVTKNGPKRMKLLSLELSEAEKLIIRTVQLEGKTPVAFEQVKEIFV